MVVTIEELYLAVHSVLRGQLGRAGNRGKGLGDSAGRLRRAVAVGYRKTLKAGNHLFILDRDGCERLRRQGELGRSGFFGEQGLTSWMV